MNVAMSSIVPIKHSTRTYNILQYSKLQYPKIMNEHCERPWV